MSLKTKIKLSQGNHIKFEKLKKSPKFSQFSYIFKEIINKKHKQQRNEMKKSRARKIK